ncbi:MAG: ribonuclease H-like domain-containing protein [Candidatus Pacebacteria bacterium]|nr:ribonuclease H-like domain-containing protein [Candidatus Paceibacterota bacterium]
MRTLVIDIETVGEQWSDIDAVTKDVLTRWITRTAKNDAEKRMAIRDLEEGLGFSPLTGEIVAIGLFDLEHQQGAVYYQANGTEREEEIGAYVLKPRSEADMLLDFWEGAQGYDTFVTFNGRRFDVPFLNIRSMVHGIRPTQHLMQHRYLERQGDIKHIDLQDQLTFYGAMLRKPSLHLYCRAMGIESSKEKGIAGDDVGRLFTEKKFRDIAVYNADDVTATAELYEQWLDTLAPELFDTS